MQRARKSWDDKAQKRLTATSNILAQVKALKMSGLTSTASKTLRSLHDEELNASLGEKHERIILHVLGKTYCLAIKMNKADNNFQPSPPER